MRPTEWIENRRAVHTRAREIVEESGVLWAVALDQAKSEPNADVDASPSITSVAASYLLLGMVLLVVLLAVLGYFLLALYGASQP